MHENETKNKDRMHQLSGVDITEILPDPIIEIDLQGNIVYINNAGRDLFDINNNDDISFFSIINPDDIEKCRKCFQDIKNEKCEKSMRCNLISFDGSELTSFFKMSPLYENEEIVGFLGIIQDTTELTKKENELQKLNIELEKRIKEKTIQMESALNELRTEVSIRKKMSQKLQYAKEEISQAYRDEQDLSEMKSRFISMITHEFRTPLTIILSSTNMLEQFYRKGNEEKMLKHLSKIKKSSKNLAHLIERTITLSKTEAGVITVNKENFDIIEFMKEMSAEIRLFDKDKHQVELHTENDSLLISSDKNLLTTIFNNIISNALKYTEEDKRIKINLKTTKEFIKISVADEGIGIPDREINTLFEPFYRCSNVGLRQGSGLGMSIVRKCVELLDGDIQIKSQIGKGTEVIIILPFEDQ